MLDFLGKQRDLYKYLHDQTVRLMNHGYKSAEIAERLALPGASRTWHVRGYYGTLSHNAKAVYQRYIGWYDAQSRQSQPAAAGGARAEVRGVHGRGRRR